MTTLDDLQALMAARIEAAGLDEDGARIPKRTDPHRAELSFAQRRIWMHQQLSPDSVAYNVCLCLHFAGNVDDDALAQAFEALAFHNEVLRTTFHHDGGSPYQRIHDTLPLLIDRTDLTHLTSAAAAERVRALSYAAARSPYDLTQEGPMRVGFVRTSDDSLTVILTVQHIAWDGMTFAALSRSVERSYRQLLAGGNATVGAMPTTQAADHAAWEQSGFDELDDSHTFEFWKDQLEPPPPPLTLPTDKPAPPVLSERGARVDRRMDPRCAHTLTTQSRRLGTTPYTVFLTAYYLLLSRFSGSTDVTIGTAVANRDDPGLEDLIGNFGNTLALRAPLLKDSSFAESVRQVRTITEDAFAHQDYPFDRIVERLNPVRTLGQPVFFQAMLLFLTQDIEGPQLPGCSIRWSRVDNHSAQLPLALEVFVRGEQMDVEATYATDLFESQTIDRMLDYLEELLVTIGDEPETPIRHLLDLTGGDRTLIERWSHGSTGEVGPLITDLITEHARTTPDRTAIRFGDTVLTYREFEDRVNQLARHLMQSGTRVGDRVVVMLSRGETLPIALAAVVLAGATYVPVDITYPAERVAFLIGDSDPTAVLADSSAAEQHSEALHAAHAAKRLVMMLDEPSTALAIADQQNIAVTDPERDRSIGPDDPALLIYTSGSTGEPKGVLISAAAIASRLRWQTVQSGTGGVFLAKSSIGFIDASTELLGALIRGGTVVVAGADAAHDPLLLMDLIDLHGVTELVTVPALAHALATLPTAQEHLSSIRRWICSGETLTDTTMAALHGVVPDAEIVNFYGSTEVAGDATALVSAADAASESGSGSSTGSIGSPVADTAAFVLDQFLRPTPPGVTGELYIAGAQLATGYHNRAARTAERFVANPLRDRFDGDHSSSRLYRTGDLARWNRFGQLEYLGRTDDQVKLRGFRIELDEVRVALESHPSVGSAIATTFAHDPRDETTRYLAAYFTREAHAPSGGQTLAEELRGHMSERLPQHMMPSAFVELDRLPLNPHGKIDRKALLPPEFTDTRGVGQLPHTDTERHVADAFLDVLSLPVKRAIHVDDNFFHLGGHSLLATRLVAHLNTVLDSGLTMRTVFEAPTVAQLAAEADRTAWQKPPETPTTPTLEEVAAQPRPDDLVLSAAQERLWFLHRAAGPSSVYNIAPAFRIHGPVDVQALKSALTDLAARHEVLRTLIDDTERIGAVQTVIPAGDVDVHVTQMSDADVTVEEFLSEQSKHCFELDRELPFRAALLNLRTGECILSITVHHIAFDEWSGPILFADLATAYQSRVIGQAPSWHPLPVQYADHATWQRMSMGTIDGLSATAARQLEYWQEKLAGIPDEIAMPTDRARPAIPDHLGDSLTLTLPAAHLAALRKTCRRSQVTEYMAANAAVAIALNLNGGGLDIPVGTPISGRGQPAISDLIGFFVNTLVIRNDLSGDPTLSETLSRVRRSVLDAFDHQDLPFERLVDALNPERSMARHPLFQTMAVYRSAGVPLRFAEMAAEFVPSQVAGAKFDLEFEFQETLNDDLTINLVYATELFDESTARRLLDTAARVLMTIADDPTQRMSQLSTMSPGDDALIGRWSTAPTHAVPDETLDRLLARQCDQTPEHVAISLGTNTWTYREFASAINRLARALISRGVGAGDRVAIMAPRSPELIVAIAGVLSTGAAYVPVDPVYPPDRIAYLLSDSGPALILARSDAERSTAANLTDVPVVTYEEASTQRTSDDPPDDRPITPDELVRPHGPSDAAYVMYTSGSTGTPKGVIIDHSNIVALLAATSSMEFSEHDVWTLFHSYSFDFSVWEIWGALLHGGRLVIVDQDTARDPSRFGQLLRDEAVTVLSQTPSAFYSLIQSEHDRTDGPAESLRMVVFGGEALDYRKIADWRKHHPDSTVRLVNMFGITETTVHTTVHPISADEGQLASVIGRPLPNLSTFVLDGYLRPTPPGVTGELYVAGPQVAAGYFNRPALSASRFIANPFPDSNPARRLYRSGDLARWSAAGTLEYRGRADQQVKIRGFRIELDEIRSALEAHPAISRASVIACDRSTAGTDGQYLVGHWVAEPQSTSATISASDLRAYLHSVLPAHMVPAHLMQIPAIPITANGKLDRRALPEPTRDIEQTAGRAPATASEHSIALAYADVLDMPGITVDDDFFSLGGDSISALALVRRARQLGVVITAPDVFTHRTVAALARICEPVESADATRASVTASVDHRPTSMTPMMRRHLLDGVDLSAFRHTLLLAAPPNLDVELLEQALRAVIGLHAALSLSVGRADGQPTIHYTPREPSAPLVRRVDATALSDIDVRDRIFEVEREQAGAIDLTSGPLTTIAYFDRGSAPGIVAWTANHCAVDQVSWEILTADLKAEYEGSGDQHRATDHSFFTWVELLNAPEGLEKFRRGADHWVQERNAAAPMNPAAEPTTVGDQRTVGLTLSGDLSSRLVSEPARRGSSTNNVLLAGLTLAIQRWRAAQAMSGTTGVLIDVEGHGRSASIDGPALDTTVGWFTTLHPVAVRVSTDAAIGASLPALQDLDCLVAADAAMKAVPADDIGYGVLRHLDPQWSSQSGDLPHADVQFRFGGTADVPDADQVSPWSSPRFLPRLITAAPPESFLSHSLTVDVVGRRSPQQTEFDISCIGDRSFTTQTLQDLATYFEEALESISHTLEVLPENALLAVSPAPQSVAPMANQHRLRLSGVPLEQFILTEVADLDGETGSEDAHLSTLVYSTLLQHDSLRQRLIAKNRLLWTMEVSAAPSARSVEAMVSVHDLSERSRDSALEAASKAIRGRMDPREGSNLHVAVVNSLDGRHLMVAIHGAVADRRSVHIVTLGIAAALESTPMTTGQSNSSISDVAALLESRAQSATADTALERFSRISPADDPSTARTSDAETVVATATLPGAFDPAGITNAFASACGEIATLEQTAIDLEVDQRAFLSDELAVDEKVGWLTTTYPHVADDPVAPSDRPWYSLIRYNHRRGRRLLKAVTDPAILLTRSFGQQTVPARREGIECSYPIVGRYRLSRNSVELEVVTTDSRTAEDLVAAWHRNLGE